MGDGPRVERTTPSRAAIPTHLDRILAITGTVLTWLPIAAMLFTALVGTIAARSPRIDYLMPAELFPAFLLGGVLLIVAAIRTRRRRRAIIVSVTTAVVGLVAAQGLAVLSGLASGARAAEGAPLVVVMSFLALSTAAMVATGVVGWRLARELRKHRV